MKQKKFCAILADPPWQFKTYTGLGTPHRTEVDHYRVSSVNALGDIPVWNKAADDCALFMWVVDSNIRDAFTLAGLWGFKFKTVAFVWEKVSKSGAPRIGMGYWTRKQTEQCWLFTRGHPKRLGKGVRQLIQAPRREHSRKPDEIYERIESLVGGPYLEMFARQSWPNWTAWGDEKGKFK